MQFPYCCSEKDIEDASEVAFQLDIPYEVLDFTADFQDKIIEKFIRTYEEGGTPNPCIDCNRFMKFDKLLDFAFAHGLNHIVTGHYARIERDENTGRYILKKGVDEGKDQSYVLYTSRSISSRTRSFRSAHTARHRYARWRKSRASATRASTTVRTSVSCPTAIASASWSSTPENAIRPAILLTKTEKDRARRRGALHHRSRRGLVCRWATAFTFARRTWKKYRDRRGGWSRCSRRASSSAT